MGDEKGCVSSELLHLELQPSAEIVAVVLELPVLLLQLPKQSVVPASSGVQTNA